MGWDKTIVDVSVSWTDVLIETVVESVESAMVVDKTAEGLHGDADASRYSTSSWRAEFVNLMVVMGERTKRDLRGKMESRSALHVFEPSITFFTNRIPQTSWYRSYRE